MTPHLSGLLIDLPLPAEGNEMLPHQIPHGGCFRLHLRELDSGDADHHQREMLEGDHRLRRRELRAAPQKMR